MKVGFVGLSHLGIVTSAAVASKGFDVVGYDPRADLAENIQAGQLPIFEPGLADLIARTKSRIRYSSESAVLADCDLLYLSQDVPTNENNVSELGPVQALFEDMVRRAKPQTTLVVHSQVSPGFTRKLCAISADLISAKQLTVCYQVETLIFGNAVQRALQPERYIVGCTEEGNALPPAYRELLAAFDCPVLTMRYESAELAKISINMFLVSSLATTNTLAELCERLGAVWSEIEPALRLDKRIGQFAYLKPGLGVGGGNLERDLATVTALARTHRTDHGIVDAWFANSKRRAEWVQQILAEYVFPRLAAPKIAVWGFAYKAGTNSTKNSPALPLLRSLAEYDVTVFDPEAVLPADLASRVTKIPSPLECCRAADVLIIMTAWPVFSSIAVDALQTQMKGDTIIDPYGVLGAAECAAARFRYFALGLPFGS